MPKLLVFDIWGEYAHFRKPYTTTSPLTYSIPSRTALTGIIGAILGIEKGRNNIELNYENCNLSLRVLNPIKKVIINQNLINTKIAEMMSRIKPKGGRTQIRFETLKDVKYRIYVEIFDIEKYKKLKELLENHKSIFSPCLGITEHLANFSFIGEYEYFKENGEVSVDSVVSLEHVTKGNVEFEGNKEYFSDTYALEMSDNREVLKYGEILIERTAKQIKVNKSLFIKIENGDNIIWI